MAGKTPTTQESADWEVSYNNQGFHKRDPTTSIRKRRNYNPDLNILIESGLSKQVYSVTCQHLSEEP